EPTQALKDHFYKLIRKNIRTLFKMRISQERIWYIADMDGSGFSIQAIRKNELLRNL
ncbi:hypothetical protein LOAG_15705, partial [Loa loa]